jgi:AraC family transcriptional regulator
MDVISHATEKYATGRRVSLSGQWSSIHAEIWHHDSGRLNDLTLDATEVAVLLEGRSKVYRTGDGRKQETYAVPGTFWICPSGTFESDIRLEGTLEKTLHIFLPPMLVGEEALRNFDLNPDSIGLDYVGGRHDPFLDFMAAQFCAIIYSNPHPTQQLRVDGLRAALAAHLLEHYAAGRKPSGGRLKNEGSLESGRLKRVLDAIEDRLADDLSLFDLAQEACLSPYHFSRRFQQTIGMSPHRYVVTRRVKAAQDLLARTDQSLVTIALDTGFGGQANFNRTFKAVTGQTPGQYRRSKRLRLF